MVAGHSFSSWARGTQDEGKPLTPTVVGSGERQPSEMALAVLCTAHKMFKDKWVSGSCY